MARFLSQNHCQKPNFAPPSFSDVGLESGKGLESDSRPIFCGLGLGLGWSGLGLGLGLEGPGLEFDSMTRFPSHNFVSR